MKRTLEEMVDELETRLVDGGNEETLVINQLGETLHGELTKHFKREEDGNSGKAPVAWTFISLGQLIQEFRQEQDAAPGVVGLAIRVGPFSEQ